MTEKMQAYAVEQGDEIVLLGEEYHVMDVRDGRLKDYCFRIMDSQGDLHEFEADMNDMIRVIVDPYVEA